MRLIQMEIKELLVDYEMFKNSEMENRLVDVVVQKMILQQKIMMSF